MESNREENVKEGDGACGTGEAVPNESKSATGAIGSGNDSVPGINEVEGMGFLDEDLRPIWEDIFSKLQCSGEEKEGVLAILKTKVAGGTRITGTLETAFRKLKDPEQLLQLIKEKLKIC